MHNTIIYIDQSINHMITFSRDILILPTYIDDISSKKKVAFFIKKKMMTFLQ